jgi:hypothetical protein
MKREGVNGRRRSARDGYAVSTNKASEEVQVEGVYIMME